MENGSAPRSEGNGADLNGSVDASANGHLPLSARLLGVGVRGARSVGKATGIDRAVELAAEEAIVGAIESEAVERAMARVLNGPVVEEAVQGAIESDAVKRALVEAMDSELVDEVWRRLLASEEAQQLVERIAGAPELRAAISAQGAGLIEDVGRTIGKIARDFDDSFERIVRRIFFRKRRALPSPDAGFVSRALAYVIDGVFVNLGFTALVALLTLLDNAFGGASGGASNWAIAVGSTAWVAIGSTYLLVFWALAGQTPGMRFVGIRLNERRLSLRRGLKRLLGLYLSVVTLGIGFLGVIFRENRRGWEDRFSGTEVLYDERRPEPAPWSRPVPLAASAVGVASGEPALQPEGAAAGQDQQGDVDRQHDQSAERFAAAAGPDRDA
jgi:uncharacterized RDD family membrane protein YckC